MFAGYVCSWDRYHCNNTSMGNVCADEEPIGNEKSQRRMVTKILQLHPPTPLLIPRKSVEDCDIEGYFIPSKTRVLLNAWAIGRQPVNWVDPEVFRLERFIGSDIDYKGQDFALIPFGAGRRGCPAISFAASVIELALANLLLCFDWALPNGMNHKDLDMTEDSGLTVHKKTLCY
ncbi:hypothetical protein AMTR_s05343p00003150 [Amborella trichopoda]|uniref:Cytochrome P450 n=1 Tax=Amborella trichopoda TaxID=13333 RepID=U5CU91_AMBTC|nr:hypothetical protein AMTR_s05343p00003150 [Amborella trichopoda]